MLGSSTLTLMATPCASTVSHASTVSNASAKIVLATIAVETVVVVEAVVSAEMPNASVVKVKTISSWWALVEKAGRERRIADLCKSRARRDV
jgi:hypothetical protein